MVLHVDRYIFTNISEEIKASFFRVNLENVAVSFSETLVPLYQRTGCNIRKDSKLNHRLESPKLQTGPGWLSRYSNGLRAALPRFDSQ
jgi:hypothetical protein